VVGCIQVPILYIIIIYVSFSFNAHNYHLVDQRFQMKAKSLNEGVCGIVYTHKRADATDIAKHLRENGFISEGYHAGLSPKKREEVQEKWTNGEIPVICATIAFGMGIDKRDVRFVIHWTVPKSMESFYQESGRAGRDGEKSTSIVYYSRRDVEMFDFIIRQSEKQKQDMEFTKEIEKQKHADATVTHSSARSEISKPQAKSRPLLLVKATHGGKTSSQFVPPRNAAFNGGKLVRSTDRRPSSTAARAPLLVHKEDPMDPKRKQLNVMKTYCEHFGCRRKAILAHFGESVAPHNQCKQGCDHCTNANELKSVLHNFQASQSRGKGAFSGVGHLLKMYKHREGDYGDFEDEESRFGGRGEDGSDEEDYHTDAFVTAGSLKRKKRGNAGEGFQLVGGSGGGFHSAKEALNVPSKMSTEAKFAYLERSEALKTKIVKPTSAKSRLRAIMRGDDEDDE
jgi:superfamily II DNA helicase RecQ